MALKAGSRTTPSSGSPAAASAPTSIRSWPSSSTSVSQASSVIGQRLLGEGWRIDGSFTGDDLQIVGTGAGASRDAAGAAKRQTDVKDRVADDLDSAGRAGKWVFGAQTAHHGSS